MNARMKILLGPTNLTSRAVKPRRPVVTTNWSGPGLPVSETKISPDSCSFLSSKMDESWDFHFFFSFYQIGYVYGKSGFFAKLIQYTCGQFGDPCYRQPRDQIFFRPSQLLQMGMKSKGPGSEVERYNDRK